MHGLTKVEGSSVYLLLYLNFISCPHCYMSNYVKKKYLELTGCSKTPNMKRKFTMIISFIRTWIITFTCTCQLEVIYFVSFKGKWLEFQFIFNLFYLTPWCQEHAFSWLFWGLNSFLHRMHSNTLCPALDGSGARLPSDVVSEMTELPLCPLAGL